MILIFIIVFIIVFYLMFFSALLKMLCQLINLVFIEPILRMFNAKQNKPQNDRVICKFFANEVFRSKLLNNEILKKEINQKNLKQFSLLHILNHLNKEQQQELYNLLEE